MNISGGSAADEFDQKANSEASILPAALRWAFTLSAIYNVPHGEGRQLSLCLAQPLLPTPSSSSNAFIPQRNFPVWGAKQAKNVLKQVF